MKVTARLRVKDNWRTMLKLERELPDRVGNELKDTAEAIVTDIRKSWSGFYPPASKWGNPPAVRSGTLDKGITVEEQGRDLLGRFAGVNAQARYIRIDTGDKNYAMALEDPNYLNRSFLKPAVENRGIVYLRSEFRRGKIFRV